ncbi:MAG: class II aldolase/adducin family protein [Methanobrevibacter millerae]|uniref:Class II aldolase/adducin family protein n=1 Tax=Methanobrevibacter millerae TaxID=230361 RepID=A0A8T3VBB4_9EURY|nr:class II aldolase/adducin family protein [Methanobrevibacter millerae]MBE6505399.1 class II aldolase/adducin family protein [Methanobrevibacter millerae]
MQDNVSKLIKVCNNLYDKQLASGKSGNVSIRLDDYIAITPTLKAINGLNEDDIVLVDMNSNTLTKGNPSSEVGMHLAIYKKRNDVNAIIHTHSPYTTGFAFSNKKIKRLEGFGQIKNPYIASIEYEEPGSEELALNASEAIEKEDVLLLKNHGVICVGNDLDEVESLAIFIEESAKTQFVSYILNSVKDIK